MIELSIVICSYNREKYIRNALESVTRQSVSPDIYEVIVIDNNSSDTTPTIVNNFINDHPEINIHCFSEQKQGLTFARNRGIKESQGKIISFIDDDAVANIDYVKNILIHFKRNEEVVALGGKVIPIYPECDEPRWLSKYIEGIVSKVDLGDKVKMFDEKYPVGCNMAFRKEVFETVGMFNEELVLRSDEKDLFIRLSKVTDKILYAPDVYVEHVMSKHRVSKEGVAKVSRITGEGEYFRNKSSTLSYLKTLSEYLLKLVAAMILAVIHLFKGTFIKGKYLVLVRWHILKGFLNAKKTLNADT